MAFFAQSVALTNVAMEVVLINGVNDLSQVVDNRDSTYIEQPLAIKRPLDFINIRQVLLVCSQRLDLLEDILSSKLIKVGHVDDLHILVEECLCTRGVDH